jgi:hypothetical protein
VINDFEELLMIRLLLLLGACCVMLSLLQCVADEGLTCVRFASFPKQDQPSFSRSGPSLLVAGTLKRERGQSQSVSFEIMHTIQEEAKKEKLRLDVRHHCGTAGNRFTSYVDDKITLM